MSLGKAKCELDSCGKWYEKLKGNQKYCSPRCNQIAYNQSRSRSIVGSKMECEKCHKEVVRKSGIQRYCSECAYILNRRKTTDEVFNKARNNETDKKIILAWLKSSPLSIGEISRRLDRSRETVIKLRDELTQEGYDVNLDAERQQMVLSRDPTYSPHALSLEPMYRNYITFGLISDTQLCSMYQQLSLLHTAYKIGEEEKISFMLHSGDLVDGEGVYRGQEYEIFAHGADAQADYVINNYPESKKFKTYIVAGNHDLSFKQKIGHNIVRRICEKRKDLIYRGDLNARFNVKKLNFEIIHPRGGQSYARSYRAQRIIEASTGDFITRIRSIAIRKEEIPQIFISGHLHINFWMTYRGVQSYLVPCFQSQTPFLKSLGLYPEIGMFIVRANFDSRGNVTKLVHDYRDFTAYVKDHDY